MGSDEAAHRADADVTSGQLYGAFLKNIGPVADLVHPIRADSSAAATQFSDHSIDFLYVDAGHTYDAVKRDVVAWWPRRVGVPS